MNKPTAKTGPTAVSEPESKPARADFSHLKQLAERTTARYPFYEYEGVLDPLPTLIVNCAVDNPQYLKAIKGHRDEVNKKVDKMQRKNKRLRAADVVGELLSPIDRASFAGIIVTGWFGVLDASHEEVLFTTENCQDFLDSITDSDWEGVRQYCYDPRNFRVFKEDDGDAEATGKN